VEYVTWRDFLAEDREERPDRGSNGGDGRFSRDAARTAVYCEDIAGILNFESYGYA
jgi:hypothetical protein